MPVGLWQNLAFRHKIQLYAALVSLVALVIAGVATISFEAVSFRKDYNREITAIADITSQMCASALTFNDDEFATRILAGLAAEESIINSCIYEDGGGLFAAFRHEDSEFAFPALERLSEYDSEKGTIWLTRPVVYGDEQVGTMFIQARMDLLAGRIWIYSWGAVVILLLAQAVALTLANRIQKTITQPVVELQRTANLVSRRADYSARAHQYGCDELGQLTAEFNEMLDQIQAKDLALRESEARFSSLLTRIDEVIFRLALPDRNLEYCSPPALNMFGYSSEQLIEDPRLFRSIIHPESVADLDEAYSRAADGELASQFEFRIIDRNGDEKWLVQTNSPVFDEEGKLTAIEGCCFDITDRILAEADRELFMSELAQSHRLEALGTLTGGIAHDFNNVLAAIMGNADMASNVLAKDHSAAKFITPILQASERAKDLVRQILTFARQDPQEKGLLSLDDLIRETTTLIRASLPTTIRIETNLSGDLDQVMGNLTQLHQVIMNLCANALHAMRENGGLLTLEVNPVSFGISTDNKPANLPPGKYLELSIGDSGEGISQAVQEHMFEPFFTTKSKTEGTGMGLAVVYGIISEHGGDISVSSRPGEGTTFRILLPCVQAAEKQEVRKMDELRRGSGRILFVDDEDMLVNLGTHMLEMTGYDVDGFTDPLEALAKFREMPDIYNLVISDFTMPHLTGLALAEHLHAIREDIPIVIMTGNLDRLALADAAEFGVVHIASKPMSVKTLISLVDDVLTMDRKCKAFTV
ncbi:MAG: response regulator [bacterium]|nr:response regulator [bacterium]